MKKFKMLDKPWKELLFAFTAFGPNLLMGIMGAYYSDAVNPAALGINEAAVQSISGVCLVTPLLYSVLAMIAKIFDGIIDVPLGHLTDNLKSKLGKRRAPIIYCFIPMVISYALLWVPIAGQTPDATGQLINTLWFVLMSFIFFGTYTMNLICFYGSIGEVSYDDAQRLRVSSYKSFFDTIYYVLTYALVPVFLQSFKGTNLSIENLVFMLLPLMCTVLIPVFMIKEGDKNEAKLRELGYDIPDHEKEEQVPLLASIKKTMLNKPALRWNIVNSTVYFGLQMFLVSMNALIVGLMGLETIHMTILNTAAFAPIPLMLYLFNKLRAKKGMRFTYQSCVICFGICILSFLLASEYVMGPGNYTAKLIIGGIGGVIGSWALGAFFMMPLLIPSSISATEEKLTGVNQSAMYFAGQALFTCVIGAIATGVYDAIKNLFVTRDFSKIVFETSRELAATKLGMPVGEVFCLGTMLVPIIVSICCIAGCILARKMCKNYEPQEIAEDLGMMAEYEAKKDLFPVVEKKEEKTENVGVNIGIWVLTGTIFSFIWRKIIINRVNELSEEKVPTWLWLVSIPVFPLSGIILFKTAKLIKARCDKEGIACKDYSVLSLIFGILGFGIVGYALQQAQLNKMKDL
ncbi:MAG: MFS transporter [Clostridia bacterium]|nr:MFS transporter [Clostridia bacterium]